MSATHLHDCSYVPQPSRRGAALDGLSDTARWVFGTLATWRRRIRERDQLGRLDDRMLRDIGVTRTEALHLSSKPFWKE